MKAVVAAFNQEKALVGAFSVITNLRICFGWNFLNHYIKGRHGRTPLYIAAEEGHVFVVKCLLAHSTIDVNSR